MKLPEVADHESTGITPGDELIDEVSATSLPAACSHGDMLYAVIVGHSIAEAVAVTLIASK